MPPTPDIQWAALFIVDVPLLEIIVRGTIVYIGVFLMLRFVLKRQSGTAGFNDLLVLVMLADAVQNGMSANYQSITCGLVLVATIVFWSYVLDWLGYRVPAIQKLIEPPPLMLVRNGTMQRENMKKELITREELLSLLRENGIADISKVRRAYLEGDGKLSVITR
jgi:uncharacterized membrane protein YcaP (DUF421 family)